MRARGGLRRHRDCPWARVETESSREHSMMARYSLMQRGTWALKGSATLFVVGLCAVFSLSFGQMEDDLVNAVLVTEVEQDLGQLKQGMNHVVYGKCVQVSVELGGTRNLKNKQWIQSL